MRLNQLIGKPVIRTKSISNGHYEDRNYMSTNDYILTMVEMIDGTPLGKIQFKGEKYDTCKVIDLNAYDDDNWKDATNIIKEIVSLNDHYKVD